MVKLAAFQAAAVSSNLTTLKNKIYLKTNRTLKELVIINKSRN